VGGAVNSTFAIAGQAGNAVFTLNTDYAGAASSTYKIKDSTDSQATATISLTVGTSGNSKPSGGHGHDQRRQPGANA
jgi:hypothetical protein